MPRTIKNAAIPFSGYLYQNFVGLNVLCDWLDDPTLYEWVKFEADEDADIAPAALDDVVAKRRDGSYLLRQVKFTIDASNDDNSLSWDWLLSHRPNGTSLIQKWSSAYFEIRALGVMVDAALETNRRPDRVFDACLLSDKSHIDTAKIPRPVISSIESQIGKSNVEDFFSNFAFLHSKQDDISLSHTTLDRYVPRHTNREGYLALMREAIEWALRLHSPAPGGHITLPILRGVLSAKRPKPLEQDFRIPHGYRPPNAEFALKFIEGITKSSEALRVLWGSPGQGKSTFLSYVTEQLKAQGLPVIRHHYFLRIGDTDDRLSLQSIADSLIAQMKANFIEYVQGIDDNAENLRDWIAACADGQAESNKAFVLVIDGLDHVWRENAGNKTPLDSLFNQIFPLHKNVVLVMGSQRVSASHLPSAFQSNVEESQWIELPRMSLTSVVRWLDEQNAESRFDLPAHSFSTRDQMLAELGQAFLDLSGGHPLLLTYNFEQLIKKHRELTNRVVQEAPVHSCGDIQRYYTALWSGLSFAAKDALHLIADSGFIWPSNGLERCLNVRSAELQSEIGHLLHVTDIGVHPFHGSLLVFTQAQPDHGDSVERRRKDVANWLTGDAPHFHKWGWLWIYQAQLGNYDSLLNLTSREWIIESLAKAYPADQMEKMLVMAEEHAFKSGDYARAVKIRKLKINLLNGPDFQIDHFSRVQACAMSLSEDIHPFEMMVADMYTLNEEDSLLIGSRLVNEGRSTEAIAIQERLIALVNDKLTAGAYSAREFQSALKYFLALAAKTGRYNPKTTLQNILKFKDIAEEALEHFANELSRHNDVQLLADIYEESLLPPECRARLELAIIRLAGKTGAAVHEWGNYPSFCNHAIVACWDALYASELANWPLPEITPLDPSPNVSYDEARKLTEEQIHQIFFVNLAQSLRLRGAAFTWTPTCDAKQMWLREAEQMIANAAQRAGRILVSGGVPSYEHIYRHCAALIPPEGLDEHRLYVPVKRAMVTIASDLFLLCMRRSGLAALNLADISRAFKSPHFAFYKWLRLQMEITTAPTERDALVSIVSDERLRINKEISPFNERTEDYLSLCELAVFSGLHDEAKVALLFTLQCILGYGWRKNDSLLSTLRAIESIKECSNEFAREQLKRVAPIFAKIDKMTEDDGVDPPDIAGLIIDVLPESYPVFFDSFLENSDWHYATEAYGQLLSRLNLNEPTSAALTSAIWDHRLIASLKRNSTQPSSRINEIVKANAKLFGYPVESFALDDDRYGSPSSGNPLDFDPATYGPNELAKLLTDLSEVRYDDRESALHTWLEACSKRNLGMEALKELERHCDENDTSMEISCVFDIAFAISLKLQGKVRAYRWLVLAHRYRYGWERYHGDETRHRFDLVAKHYKTKYDNFIQDTSKSLYSFATDIVIPNFRLVQFFVANEQIDKAKSIVTVMVESMLEEFSCQPLSVPHWITVTDNA